MAVTKRILDLITLALQDRVLTFKERQTIVQTATNEGVAEAEINAVLDNMLAQRLKNYAKEELKRCPTCGAQIPLISEECLFCGELLEKREVAHKVDVSGADADIIRSENKRTEKEDINIKNCPDCGAPFPLMSNICTHCGHVLHARIDSEFNVKNLITSISTTTQKLIDAPPTSFAPILIKYVAIIVIMMTYIGLGLYGEAVDHSSTFWGALGGFLWVIALLLSPFVIVLIKSIFTERPDKDDKAYLSAQLDYQKYTRLVQAFYGDDAEAREYLKKLGDEMRKIKKSHRRGVLIFLGIVIVSVLLPFVPQLLDWVR
ncbi:MAG: zinc ribbon domain-containing protein [Bacteroidales bacterium]|nr:zinc ribbon domain-containing protein [Bacteroidales bacterium]